MISIKITIPGSTDIKFCPLCGLKLKKVIESNGEGWVECENCGDFYIKVMK